MDPLSVIGIVFGSVILVTLAIIGIGLKRYPPKDINGVYGYRTGISSKNQETWDYTQKLAGKTMMICATISLPVYALLLLLNPSFLFLDASFWGQAHLSRLLLGVALGLIVVALTLVIVQIKGKRFWKNTIEGTSYDL